MFTSFDKAIVAFLGSIVSMLVLAHVPLPSWLQDQNTLTILGTSLGGLLTGLLTFITPNKPTGS